MPIPPLPDVTSFVDADIPAWAANWERHTGSAPSARDTAHVIWRRLVEGMSQDELLRSVSDPDIGWVRVFRPVPFSYEQFLNMVDALAQVRVDSGGRWWTGILALWGYQLVIDQNRYGEILADAIQGATR